MISLNIYMMNCQVLVSVIFLIESFKYTFGCISYVNILGHVERMRCTLLQQMILAFVSLSVMRTGCAKTAE